MRGKNFLRSLVIVLLAVAFCGCTLATTKYVDQKIMEMSQGELKSYQAETDSRISHLEKDANQVEETIKTLQAAVDPTNPQSILNKQIQANIAPLCNILQCYQTQTDQNSPAEIRSSRLDIIEVRGFNNETAIANFKNTYATKKYVRQEASHSISRSQFDHALSAIAEREKNLVRIVSGGNTITAYLEFAPYESELSDAKKKQIHDEIEYMDVDGERLCDTHELIDLKGYYSPGGPEENLAIARAEAVFNELKDEYQNLSIHSIVKPISGGLGRREVRMIFKKKTGGQMRTQGILQLDPNATR